MALTITIPGAVTATTGATAPAVLNIGVGTPGATGPQGVPGQGVPTGGTTGQYLVKASGTNYDTAWQTLSLAGYATESWVNAQGFLESGDLAGYATESWTTTNFAPIAAGQPISGTVGQVLTKNSGTSYDSSWQTLIPGDRYLTTSTTSLTVSNGTKSLTVGTGLSYSPTQDLTIAYDASNHMHGTVTSYNSGTGVLIVDIHNHTGSGTYSSWTVNVGGTVPLQSIYWGDVLGVIGDQSDLATALNAKLEITDAASTYYPLSNPSGYITSSSLAGYATESWVSSQDYLTDAPSDGSKYVRKDAAWESVTVPTNNSQLATNVFTNGASSLTVDTANTNGIIMMNSGSSWIYLPDNSTPFNVGAQCLFLNNSGGAIYFAVSGSASFFSLNYYITVPNGGCAAAVKVGADSWYISGNLTA